MNILFVESDQFEEYNCSNWRCVMPMRAIRHFGHNTEMVRIEEWVTRSDRIKGLMEKADITFVQRNIFDLAIREVLHWKTQGKVVVIDLDDSYENMTEDTGSPSFSLWKLGVTKDQLQVPEHERKRIDPPPLIQLRHGVKISGQVSSPSKLICKDWEQYAKTYWFPNYVDLDLYQRVDVYREPGKIYLGWGGSMTHLASWKESGCSEAVSRIMEEDKRIDIVLLGDPRVERFIKSQPKRKLAPGWIPSSVFAKQLCHADIGLIPLHGEYDRRRSWLKTAEFSVLGIPWIGTDAEPTQDCETGLRISNSADNWYGAIKMYIEHLDTLTETARNNMESSRYYFGNKSDINDLTLMFEEILREA